MGRVIPGDSIPDSLNCPEGTYLFDITQLEETVSNAEGRTDKVQKLMYVAHLTTREPVVGIPHREFFNIGNDDDPNAEQPETWVANARRLKLFCGKAGVPIAGDVDMDDVIAQVAGQQVIGTVVVQKDTDKNSRYYGQEQSRVATWLAPGEREPSMATSGAKPAAAKPVARTAAPARPAPARTAPPPAPAAAPRAAASAKPVAAKPAAKPAAETMNLCAFCNEQVPRSEFVAHVNTHSEE